MTAGRQQGCCDLECCGIGITQSEIAAQIACYSNRPLALFAIKLRRHRLFHNRRDRRHGNITPIACLEEDILKVGRVVDRVGGGYKFHIETSVAHIDRANLAAIEN